MKINIFFWESFPYWVMIMLDVLSSYSEVSLMEFLVPEGSCGDQGQEASGCKML